MTTAERIDVIDTLNLIKKHKDFAEMLGLVDRTKVVIGERRKNYGNKKRK